MQDSELRKIRITGLTRNVSKQHLEEIFSNFGHVVEIDLPMDPKVHLTRGYGDVLFSSGAEADTAIASMDGGQLDGNVLKVTLITDPNELRRTTRSPSPRYSRSRSRLPEDDHRRDRSRYSRPSPPRGRRGYYDEPPRYVDRDDRSYYSRDRRDYAPSNYYSPPRGYDQGDLPPRYGRPRSRSPTPPRDRYRSPPRSGHGRFARSPPRDGPPASYGGPNPSYDRGRGWSRSDYYR